MQLEGDNLMRVKRANRGAILKLLHEQGAMSRKKLAETLRLTPAAISKITGELISDGLVREGESVPAEGGVGRREVLIELGTHAFCALGVLINVGQAVLSAVWLDGSVIFSEEVSLPRPAPADETVTKLWARLRQLVTDAGIPDEKLLGVGVAVRGLTDPEKNIARNTLGALDAADYPLAEAFSKVSGLPAVMDNNVRALFAAQMFEARDKTSRSQFFIRCEYGIGAALSIGSEIWPGSTGTCSEIGHIPVIRRGGKPCSCGKSGCLETIASPAAILEDARAILSPEQTPVLWKTAQAKGADALDVTDVLEAARSGDEGAAEVVDRAVGALGTALKAVLYTVDPQKIVLYGKIFDNSYYLTRLLADMNEGIDAGHGAVVIEKSPYNQTLEDKAAAVLMVVAFFGNGGMRE